MDELNSRKNFQRNRTFAKFERRRWSALNDNYAKSEFYVNHSDTLQSISSSNLDLTENANTEVHIKHMSKDVKHLSTSSPLLDRNSGNSCATAKTPEPSLLGVKDKLILFEKKLKSDSWISFTTARNKGSSNKGSNLRKFVSKWEVGQTKSPQISMATFYINAEEDGREVKRVADMKNSRSSSTFYVNNVDDREENGVVNWERLHSSNNLEIKNNDITVPETHAEKTVEDSSQDLENNKEGLGEHNSEVDALIRKAKSIEFLSKIYVTRDQIPRTPENFENTQNNTEPETESDGYVVEEPETPYSYDLVNAQSRIMESESEDEGSEVEEPTTPSSYDFVDAQSSITESETDENVSDSDVQEPETPSSYDFLNAHSRFMEPEAEDDESEVVEPVTPSSYDFVNAQSSITESESDENSNDSEGEEPATPASYDFVQAQSRMAEPESEDEVEEPVTPTAYDFVNSQSSVTEPDTDEDINDEEPATPSSYDFVKAQSRIVDPKAEDDDNECVEPVTPSSYDFVSAQSSATEPETDEDTNGSEVEEPATPSSYDFVKAQSRIMEPEADEDTPEIVGEEPVTPTSYDFVNAQSSVTEPETDEEPATPSSYDFVNARSRIAEPVAEDDDNEFVEPVTPSSYDFVNAQSSATEPETDEDSNDSEVEEPATPSSYDFVKAQSRMTEPEAEEAVEEPVTPTAYDFVNAQGSETEPQTDEDSEGEEAVTPSSYDFVKAKNRFMEPKAYEEISPQSEEPVTPTSYDFITTQIEEQKDIYSSGKIVMSSSYDFVNTQRSTTEKFTQYHSENTQSVIESTESEFAKKLLTEINSIKYLRNDARSDFSVQGSYKLSPAELETRTSSVINTNPILLPINDLPRNDDFSKYKPLSPPKSPKYDLTKSDDGLTIKYDNKSQIIETNKEFKSTEHQIIARDRPDSVRKSKEEHTSQNSFLYPITVPKVSEEIRNKSFLTPAFKKFMGLDEESETEDKSADISIEKEHYAATETQFEELDRSNNISVDKEGSNKSELSAKETKSDTQFEEASTESKNETDLQMKEIIIPQRLERRKELKRRKRPKTIASSQPSKDIKDVNKGTEHVKENGVQTKATRKDLTRQGVSFEDQTSTNKEDDLSNNTTASSLMKTNEISSRTDLTLVISRKDSAKEEEMKAKNANFTAEVIKRSKHRSITRQQSRDDHSLGTKYEHVQEGSNLETNKTEDVSRKNKSLVIIKNGTYQIVDPPVDKYYSHVPEPVSCEQQLSPEICTTGLEQIQPILEELIKTEESYVDSLWKGLNNYGKLFEQRDLPKGLKGKKYILLGNIEQIAEFHREEFLPMLLRNRKNLKKLFDEFQRYIEEDYFYVYVLYAMNNQRSLELCNDYKKFFKILQTKCEDNLGINSFLLQPIQRVPRYSLLLKEFIKNLFGNYPLKPIIDSCCRLDRKLQILLNAINKSEVINDVECISETHEFNIFYQGKFRDVGEFNCHDFTLKRNYRSKLFIYEKCIIYTEVKRKQLIFRGRYPREHLGMTIQSKSFTLYYDRLKQQECEFMGDPLLVRQWQELIRDVINAYAVEERARLQKLHCPEVVHRQKRAIDLSLFRDSNRFSADSGISNN
ncbi:uncharacterized protein [Musca autumnalis]|uniref:uncharacterized protein n=1 Tax=Musca autumnalis TaxID=221902 RepID=UPI003CF1AEFA